MSKESDLAAFNAAALAGDVDTAAALAAKYDLSGDGVAQHVNALLGTQFTADQANAAMDAARPNPTVQSDINQWAGANPTHTSTDIASAVSNIPGASYEGGNTINYNGMDYIVPSQTGTQSIQDAINTWAVNNTGYTEDQLTDAARSVGARHVGPNKVEYQGQEYMLPRTAPDKFTLTDEQKSIVSAALADKGRYSNGLTLYDTNVDTNKFFHDLFGEDIERGDARWLAEQLNDNLSLDRNSILNILASDDPMAAVGNIYKNAYGTHLKSESFGPDGRIFWAMDAAGNPIDSFQWNPSSTFDTPWTSNTSDSLRRFAQKYGITGLPESDTIDPYLQNQSAPEGNYLLNPNDFYQQYGFYIDPLTGKQVGGGSTTAIDYYNATGRLPTPEHIWAATVDNGPTYDGDVAAPPPEGDGAAPPPEGDGAAPPGGGRIVIPSVSRTASRISPTKWVPDYTGYYPLTFKKGGLVSIEKDPVIKKFLKKGGVVKMNEGGDPFDAYDFSSPSADDELPYELALVNFGDVDPLGITNNISGDLSSILDNDQDFDPGAYDPNRDWFNIADFDVPGNPTIGDDPTQYDIGAIASTLQTLVDDGTMTTEQAMEAMRLYNDASSGGEWVTYLNDAFGDDPNSANWLSKLMGLVGKGVSSLAGGTSSLMGGLMGGLNSLLGTDMSLAEILARLAKGKLSYDDAKAANEFYEKDWERRNAISAPIRENLANAQKGIVEQQGNVMDAMERYMGGTFNVVPPVQRQSVSLLKKG